MTPPTEKEVVTEIRQSLTRSLTTLETIERALTRTAGNLRRLQSEMQTIREWVKEMEI